MLLLLHLQNTYRLLLRFFATGQGYFTEIPVNMAAVMGNEVQFNCSANVTSDVLEWSHFLNGSDSTRIYDTFSGQVLDSRFDVITTTVGGYYLVIKSASPDVGGSYRCFLFVADSRAYCEFVALCTYCKLNWLACRPNLL